MMNRWQGAALAALSAALLLAGCGAPETENDAAQEHQITYEHICERNKISALLERHKVVTIVRESTDSSNGGQDVKSTDQYTRDEEGRLQSWSHGWYYDEYGADDIYSVNVCLDEVPDGMCIIAGTNDDGSARIASVIACGTDEWYEESTAREPFLPVPVTVSRWRSKSRMSRTDSSCFRSNIILPTMTRTTRCDGSMSIQPPMT